MNDLTNITLGRLLDPKAIPAAAEMIVNYRGREAARTAAELARFIENRPELLALVAGEGVAPALALQRLAEAVKAADDALRRAVNDLRAEQSAFKERHRECVSAALRQRSTVSDRLTWLEQRIASIPAERAAARKSLEAAGLNAEQIAKVECSPTQREEDELRQEEHQRHAEFTALTRFLSDPRREVLGGLVLHGFPVGTLPHEQDAATAAAEAQQSRQWVDR